LEELKTARERYQIRYVRFFDDSLGSNMTWLKEFSEKYPRDVGLPFICYMYPSHVSAETARLLKTAGCCEVEIGVQSLNEDLSRSVLNRNMSVETIANAIDLLKREKIRLVADNIVGLPGQEEADVVRMAQFYNQRRVNRIYFFWLALLPRDPDYRIRERARNFKGRRIRAHHGRCAKPPVFTGREHHECGMDGAAVFIFSYPAFTAPCYKLDDKKKDIPLFQ